MELIFTSDEIEDAAKQFISHLDDYKLIAFYGNLGAGKTTFIKSLCKEFGVKGNVSSPTFSIINEYKTENNKAIFHIDLYRLKDVEEAVNAGVEECIYSNTYCFIEWPEKILPILPDNTLHVQLKTIDDVTRQLTVNFSH